MLNGRVLSRVLGCRLVSHASCSSQIPKVQPPTHKVRQAVPKIQTFDDVIWPKDGIGELRAMEPVPAIRPGLTPDFKHARRVVEARGLEVVHNQLTHRQYGLLALGGGFLFPHHFDMIRAIVNRHMNRNRFAVWRVEDPWLARTKKKPGTRMGGHRGSIKWYVTPVREGRVVLEVGGVIHEPQARAFLADVAGKMPMDARFVSQGDMEAIQEEKEQVEERNINPYDWDFAVKWNIQNCNKWMTMYERAFAGKSKM